MTTNQQLEQLILNHQIKNQIMFDILINMNNNQSFKFEDINIYIEEYLENNNKCYLEINKKLNVLLYLLILIVILGYI